MPSSVLQGERPTSFACEDGRSVGSQSRAYKTHVIGQQSTLLLVAVIDCDTGAYVTCISRRIVYCHAASKTCPMPAIPRKPQTEGSLTFEPDKLFDAWENEDIKAPEGNDFFPFMLHAFGLRSSDSYIYRATAEVTLKQVQQFIEYGGQGRLHEWYLNDDGKQVCNTSVRIVPLLRLPCRRLRHQRRMS